jgi:hypothetical protein
MITGAICLLSSQYPNRESGDQMCPPYNEELKQAEFNQYDHREDADPSTFNT